MTHAVLNTRLAPTAKRSEARCLECGWRETCAAPHRALAAARRHARENGGHTAAMEVTERRRVYVRRQDEGA